MITGEDIPRREDAIRFRYKNWRGETSMRTATPLGRIYKGSTDWHPEEQWLFDAYDWDKAAERTFALADADFIAGEASQ